MSAGSLAGQSPHSGSLWPQCCEWYPVGSPLETQGFDKHSERDASTVFLSKKQILNEPKHSTSPDSINFDATIKWNSQNKLVHMTSKFRSQLEGSEIQCVIWLLHTGTAFKSYLSAWRFSKGCESNFPLWHVKNHHGSVVPHIVLGLRPMQFPVNWIKLLS